MMKRNLLMAVAVAAAMGLTGAALGQAGGGGAGGAGGGAAGAGAGGVNAGAAGTAGTSATGAEPGAAGSAGISASPGTSGINAGANTGTNGQTGQVGTTAPAGTSTTTGPGVRTTGQAGTAVPGQNPTGNISTTSNVGVTLSPRQRTRIRTVLMRDRNIPRLNNPTFNVSIGTVVPSNTQLVALPATVARIYPGFRGDRVAMVGNELVIVNPSTNQIVAVLPG